MTIDLIIIHVVFIATCVGCSWYWGRKEGAQRVLQMLIDDQVITPRDLERYVPVSYTHLKLPTICSV